MQASAFNALLLADSRLPTGAYSYSAGLEPAIVGGLQPDQVYDFMLARLSSITRLECSASVVAHRLAARGARTIDYARLERAVAARTPSAAQRSISCTLGRGLLRLAQSLDLAGGIHNLAELDAPNRGTALGVLAYELGVGERTCAEVCCYEDMQGVASASLKLLPVTPARATRWVMAIGDRVAGVIDEAMAVGGSHDLPAFSAPWMEFQSEEHSLRTRRLFNA